MIEPVRCVHCEALLPAGAMFCGECGVRVGAPPASAVVTPVQAPDASVPPSPPDGAPVADSPEGEVPEGEVPEGEVPEGEVPEGEVSEGPLPEGPLPGPPTPAVGQEPAPLERAAWFVLQFSTGESVSVRGTGLVGRNPVPQPGEYFDHVVTIADPGKSVSKTHLEFGQDPEGFWVQDRYSGNGTAVRDPGGPPRHCEPGRRYRVHRGGRVEIADQFFIVS